MPKQTKKDLLRENAILKDILSKIEKTNNEFIEFHEKYGQFLKGTEDIGWEKAKEIRARVSKEISSTS